MNIPIGYCLGYNLVIPFAVNFDAPKHWDRKMHRLIQLFTQLILCGVNFLIA